MAFNDPSSGFFSPTMPSASPQGAPPLRLQPLPGVANIGSPDSAIFRDVKPITYQPDHVPGTALKGAAEVLGTSIEATDTAIKLSFENKARTDIEALQNQQIQAGFDAKDQILTEGEQEKNQPLGLQQGMKKLETIDKARRSGPMSDSQYYVQFQDIVSGLKAKWPGYSDTIDSYTEKFTGTNAEKLRRSLQADVTQLRADQLARQSNSDKYIKENEKYLPPNWREKTFTQVQDFVVEMKQKEHESDRLMVSLKLADEQGKHTALEAEKGINLIMGDRVNLVVNSMMGTVDPATGKPFKELWDSALANGFKTPEEQANMLHAIRKIRLTANTMYDGYLNQSFDPSNPGATLRNALISGKDTGLPEKVRQNVLAPLNKLEEAITNKDFGLAGEITRQIALTNSIADRKLLQNNPQLADIDAIHKKVGDQGMQILLSNPTMQGYVINALVNATKTNNTKAITVDGAPLSTLIERTKSMPATNGQQGFQVPDWRHLIDTGAKVLNNPAQFNPEVINNVVKSVYGDKDTGALITAVGADHAMPVFSRYVNPTVTKTMLKQGPEAQAQYTNWALTNFEVAFRSAGDQLFENSKSSPYYNIGYDQQTNKLVALPTEMGLKLGVGFDQAIPMSTRMALNQINGGIEAMTPIVNAIGAGSGDKANDEANINIQSYVGNLINAYRIPEGNTSKGGAQYDFAVRAKEGASKNTRQLIRDTLDTQYGAAIPAPAEPKPTDKSVFTTPANASPATPATGGGTEGLKKLIFGGESGGNPNSMHPEMTKLYGKDVNLTDKTIDQVLMMQKDAQGQGASSTAVGQGQFIYKTLKGLISDLGLKGDQKFTPELQHKLTDALLERRGLSDYKSGKIDKYQFMDNLSQEWAALPGSSGLGYYDGKNGNKANVKLKDLMSSIEQL